MTKDQVIAMAQVCMTDKFTRQYSTPLYCFNDSDIERFATLVRSSAQQEAPAAQPESVPLAEYRKLQALVSSQGIRLMEYESFTVAQTEQLNVPTVSERSSKHD